MGNSQDTSSGVAYHSEWLRVMYVKLCVMCGVTIALQYNTGEPGEPHEGTKAVSMNCYTILYTVCLTCADLKNGKRNR